MEMCRKIQTFQVGPDSLLQPFQEMYLKTEKTPQRVHTHTDTLMSIMKGEVVARRQGEGEVANPCPFSGELQDSGSLHQHPREREDRLMQRL